MKKKHSHIGLIASLTIHGLLMGGGFAWLNNHKVEKTSEHGFLSMEMVSALLEQPKVATATDTVTEEKNTAPEPETKPEPDAIPDPSLKPKQEKTEKPKKEKNKKPKKRQSEHDEHKPTKALEHGSEAKQGIVAKAISEATQGKKVVAGVIGGQKNGSQNSSSATGSTDGKGGGNADELSAYKATLQRALQRRANNSYPQREKMMRKTGTVTIKFMVLPSGTISNVSVIKSSGNSNLDAAAVDSAKAVKVPPPPAGFPPYAIAPVKFSLE